MLTRAKPDSNTVAIKLEAKRIHSPEVESAPGLEFGRMDQIGPGAAVHRRTKPLRELSGNTQKGFGRLCGHNSYVLDELSGLEDTENPLDPVQLTWERCFAFLLQLAVDSTTLAQRNR